MTCHPSNPTWGCAVSAKLLLLLLALLGAHCGGGGGNPGMTIEVVFSGESPVVFSERISWSHDDGRLVFAGGIADVYRVEARAGATPVRVTAAQETDWAQGGFLPNALSNGRIGYYLGWIEPNDLDMHLMVASAEQQDNLPAPTVQAAFNGSAVGLGADAAASPAFFSVSDAGDRAIGNWGGLLWVLDWRPTAIQPAASIGKAGDYSDCMLNPAGERIVCEDKNGKIKLLDFNGGNRKELASGSSPSWSGDGRVGYIDEFGSQYLVADPVTDETQTFGLPRGHLGQLALSRDGTRIAWRTFGATDTGLSIAWLIDPPPANP